MNKNKDYKFNKKRYYNFINIKKEIYIIYTIKFDSFIKI